MTVIHIPIITLAHYVAALSAKLKRRACKPLLGREKSGEKNQSYKDIFHKGLQIEIMLTHAANVTDGQFYVTSGYF